MGEKVRVRFRIDGSLETGVVMPGTLHQMLVARIKILSNMKLDERRKPQDGRFSTIMADHKIDYRVSTFPGYYGEKVVIRILDSYRGVRALATVALSKENLEQIRAALARPYGIILVSGPTGSGKTTTLYSMLGEIDKEHRNVVSLEDPIEYNLPSINQSQVFPEIGYTFASGLRSILRQDPDVIMVGEIRDGETAGLAIQAALTGHLVFSTIHTNTAIGVVTRLLDMGIEPYLIAPTLNLAIGQRLARSIADGCASPLPMDPGMKAIIEEQFRDLPEEYRTKIDFSKPFHEAKPTKEIPTGMKGRVPIFEVLTVDDDIQAAILKNEGEEVITKIARSKGMTFMKEDAMRKCMDGKLPFTEINEI
jgi:type IV pilus assembly protein PilB